MARSLKNIASDAPIPVADRISGFTYAIRNIVGEAKKVEATGRRVRYLNIGDPVAFGFQTPAHLREALAKAVADGHNGYGPSAGLEIAREAVAEEQARHQWPVSADRVVVTSGASEGIDLALNALVNPSEEVLVPSPTYPLYTAVLAKMGARPVYYTTSPEQRWQLDLEAMERLITPATRAIVIIHPNNPTGAVYSLDTQRCLLELAARHRLVVLSDEVYSDLAYEGSVPPIATVNPEASVIAFGSLSKGYLAPGWRTGWLTVSANQRMDNVLAAIKKLADGRLCSPVPMQYALVAALRGDRSHQAEFRAALQERAKVTTEGLGQVRGVTYAPALAAFYAMPRVALPPGVTDEQFVLELLRTTGILFVHGSGFGTRPQDGFMRIVFLASPAELREVYRDFGRFTEAFLARGGTQHAR